MDKLLTNYRTVANMSPLPTESLRARKKEKKVTWSHTSKFTSSKSTNKKRKKEIQWPQSSLAVILYNNGNAC